MLSSSDERVTPETLQLYSTNLEPNSESDFKPLSPLTMNTDLESQNFQAIKAADLKDHLLYMMSQRPGYPGIDEMEDLSEPSAEITQRNEKPDPIAKDIPVFKSKSNKKQTAAFLAPVPKSSQSILNSKKKSTYQTIMEQDGIYIPKEIKMKRKNIERITNRLQRNPSDCESFFTEEGILKNDTPPIRKIPPPFKREAILPPFHNSDEVQMLPATVWGLENSSSARSIRVEVKNIQFTVHHLSSDEDILAIRLKQLHLSYLHALQYPRENYFVTRIKALRKDLKENVDNRVKVLEEIVECHKMRDQEELKTRMKLEQLLVTWHELKDLREKNGYNITTVTLRWQSKKFDEETKQQEQAQFEKAINKLAREIVELGALKDEVIDLDQTIESIKAQHADMGLRNPGDPIWRPVLEENNISVTPEDNINDKDEIERRKQMKKARFYVAFMMGTTEMRSDDCVLTDNFYVDIDTGCKASTMRVPSDVRIHIYEYGDHKLAEVATVPIPVVNGVPKEFINYEFASESKAKNGLINQGYVSARIFVEPDTVSTQTIISNDKVIGPTRSAVSNHFLSIPKYLEIVSKHDPNDPYMANAIGSVMTEVNETGMHSKFQIDPDIDRTKFESMAPSNLCEVIHKKAYDKLYGDKSKNANPRLQLADVVRDTPKATFGNFFKALWRFITFRQGRDAIVDESLPSHRIESYSKVLLTIKGYSGLPSEVTEVVGKVRFHDQRLETGVYNTETHLFTRGKFDHNDEAAEKETTAKSLKYEFHLANSKKRVPHFSQIEDDPIRIDLFDSKGGRYLATISVPLRSVFVNGTISGDYSMFTAPFSLGFVESEETNWVNTDFRTIRIQMSLELAPQLLPPEYIDQNTCREKPQIKRRAQMIIDHFKGTRRRIVPLATTTKDETVLACRFIHPQEPPVHLDRDITSLLAFVSVIPTSPDSALPGAGNQQWSTSQEFLNDARGTNTEHAILLCNFLKYLEQDAYVILGHDALAGLCAFVGIRSLHTWIQIFDPTTGREVDLTSSEYSTLLDIGTIFNDRNVWFNQQKLGKEITKINWNLSNTYKWIPFFCKECPRIDFPSPQDDVLLFEDSPPEHSEALLRHVETVIKGVTEELRAEMSTKLTTDFDDSLAQRLEKILDVASTGETEEVNELLTKLSNKVKKKRAKMVGTPFFIAYVYDEDNIDKLREEIMDGIRARREFTSRRKGTKFAAAASIRTFPNDMYGIWVLLASVIPHK